VVPSALPVQHLLWIDIAPVVDAAHAYPPELATAVCRLVERDK
jgi:hypothetical protein